MTIKEIEELSGMTRANIRFYEKEGLLSPVRGENGYRDYSENDLEVLKRIKLLRTLHISLEEIRALHTGERELLDALEEHLKKLESDKKELEKSQEICKTMQEDQVSYTTLDAQHYLDSMESILDKPVPELTIDVVPKVRAPWRRFFARQLDVFVYSTIWMLFVSFVLGENILNQSNAADFRDTVMGLLMMLVIEPAMLSSFGTTVGKWIFGFYITDNYGRRLSYKQAFSRTWNVFLWGMGLVFIPFFNIYRYWKSFQTCANGETLSWEWESNMIQRDEKPWRFGACIAFYIAGFFVFLLSYEIVRLPKHRGEITVAEFCDNYNRFAEFYGIGNGSYLDENGSWVEKETPQGVFTLEISFVDSPKLQYIFTEENDIMTGMSFSWKRNSGGGKWMDGYSDERLLAILSFVCAQKGYGPFSKEMNDIIKQVQEEPFEDMDFERYGIKISCDQEYSGYEHRASSSFNMLIPMDGVSKQYSISFQMEKIN